MDDQKIEIIKTIVMELIDAANEVASEGADINHRCGKILEVLEMVSKKPERIELKRCEILVVRESATNLVPCSDPAVATYDGKFMCGFHDRLQMEQGQGIPQDA